MHGPDGGRIDGDNQKSGIHGMGTRSPPQAGARASAHPGGGDTLPGAGYRRAT